MISPESHKSQSVDYVNPETEPVCEVCGGPLKREAKKYCGLACYRIVQRSVDPVARFWSKVQRTDGCWLWTGSRSGGSSRAKYGQFTYTIGPNQQRHVNTHVYSYELAHGSVPDGLEVMHTCNNPRCVRPDHLKAGTHKQNVADAVRDGLYRKRDERGRKPRKLTAEQVQEIVDLHRGGMRQNRIAQRFDVSTTTVCLILSGKRRERVTQQQREAVA